jgi:MYXO-CTERM domain-containing protein
MKQQIVREMESAAMDMAPGEGGGGPGMGVTIEAQFTVGEYEIVILSARDSTGLDTWLRQNEYKIPAGAEPLLRPYVQGGMKFFVAKVDTAKVKFEDGMAMLSPLRFHYDSEEFNLPVRLGMVNSAGTQDLIVHILARGQRFEAANYGNVTISTNLDVKDATRDRFGEFYAALFDRTIEANPGAVVTEYSWDASSCDPCPTPALTPAELATLGYDVLHTPMPKPKAAAKPKDAVDELVIAAPAPAAAAPFPGGFVLTRLHTRYGKGALSDDLVFRAASPIMGGREMHGPGGTLEQGARPAGVNNFQARYAIRHAWTGAVACESPRRGIWGGPPQGVSGSTAPKPATELAFAPRGKVQLASFVAGESVPGLPASALTAVSPTPSSSAGLPQQADPQATDPAKPEAVTPDPGKTKTSKGCDAGGSASGGAWLAVLALFLLGLLRRRVRPTRV